MYNSKEKQKVYWKKWYLKNKARHIANNANLTAKLIERNKKWVNEKKAVPCKDCGIQYQPWIMQFDHLNNKEENVSVMVRNAVSIKKLEIEISKCEVVCANCHANRTYNRRNNIVLSSPSGETCFTNKT